MPTYDTPQSGALAESFRNFRCIQPGDRYTMWDGSETPSQGAKSVAFVRGPSLSMSQAYTTFHVENLPADAVVDIQATNIAPKDVEESDWTTIYQLTSDQASPVGISFFTDSGSPTCYRAVLSTYTSGDMPTLIAQR